MATTSSNTTDTTGGSVTGEATTPAEPEVDYSNPGVFVMPWTPLLIVQDQTLRRFVADLPVGTVPWDLLAGLKMHAPGMSQDIVICGWAGVETILQDLEHVMLAQLRATLR